MYDLIGDIHGQAPELEVLLGKLSYQNTGGLYHHPERKVVFLGDFIDRGDHQRRVLEIARRMIDEGSAMSVIGNHEYNAIAYHTRGSSGGFLREHNVKNDGQHEKFLQEFANDPHGMHEIIEWFRTLPLWLDLDGFRVIHACWDQVIIDRLKLDYGPDSLANDDLLHASSDRSTWQFEALETLLKGKELALPNGTNFKDKSGHRRNEIRLKWWTREGTYRDAYFGPEDARANIPNDPIEGDYLIEYGLDEKPVFVGHYWLQGDPSPLAKNIACLDYSVGTKSGKLVAYRWHGEQVLDAANFVAVDRLDSVAK